MTKQPGVRAAPPGRLRRLARGALVVFLLVVAGIGPTVVHYAPYALAALDARSRANQLADELAQLQIGDIDRSAIADLRVGLTSLRQDVVQLAYLLDQDGLVALARNLDATRGPVDQAAALVVAGDALGQAADIALGLGDQFATLREQGADAGTQSLLSGLVGIMATSTDEVDRIDELIASARWALASIPVDAPGDIRDAADLMGSAIERYGPLLDQYRSLDQALPAILGWGGQKRYLVLAQDPAELRPTGGYTGTVGIVAFRDGSLSERSFQDVFQLDLLPGIPFVQPPQSLANHLLGSGSWQLADANWSPDFPTAAQDALRLYTLESGDSNVDGVIALTTYALDRILEVTGPIDVPEYGVTVHPGEVTLTTLAQTRGASNLSTDRKAFLDDLAGTVIERLYALPPDAWPDLMRALSDISRQRLMLVWFKDPAAESLVATSPLGGAVRHEAGDYVYVVEANVAPTSKYNLAVDRRDSLLVALDGEGNAASTLELTWQNNALSDGQPYAALRSYSTSPSGLYGAYVRVYAPATSELESTTGMAIDPINATESVGSDAGRSAFGNYLLIPPGAAHLGLAWSTPSAATTNGHEWTYTLTIQKQPGLRPLPVSVTVSLPPGAMIVSVPSGATAANGEVAFSATLDQDVQLILQYRLP